MGPELDTDVARKIILNFSSRTDKFRHSKDLLGHPLFTSFPHKKESCDKQIQAKLFLTDPQWPNFTDHRYAALYEEASLTKSKFIK